MAVGDDKSEAEPGLELVPLPRAPSFWGSYRVALFGGRKRPLIGGPLPALPALGFSLAPQPPDPERLARFRAVCGVVDTLALPLTYPQMLAGTLHAALLADSRVPFPLMGLVHVENSITQLRPIAPAEPLALLARFGVTRAAKRGVQLEIHTEARAEDVLVWRSVLTALVPGTAPKDREKDGREHTEKVPSPSGDAPLRTHSLVIPVPADTGRRYASVAGDYNPIHLWALTAKPFGFKRAIVHGMWSLARVAAELHDETTARGGPWRLDVKFRKPVFLPGKVLFSAGPGENGQEFALRSMGKNETLLEGTLVPVRPG